MRENKPKLLFIIPTLGHGGAQKVIVELLDFLAKSDRFDLVLLTFREEKAPVHEVNTAVKLLSVNGIDSDSAAWHKLLLIPFDIRRKIKSVQPDLIVSFQDIANFPVILATIGLRIPVIVSERNDPEFYSAAILRKVFRNLLYPMAKNIVVQTDKIASWMPYFLQKRNVVIIPNVVPVAPKLAKTDCHGGGGFVVVSAGRLEAQKNHKLLIDSFSKLKGYHEGWSLLIYGEGSLRAELQSQIETLGLAHCASVEPATSDIFHVLSEAHLFVLSSDHEGFPNILAEAVAVGLPSIGFESVSGVSDLIENGQNGILLSDDKRNADSLAKAISALMDEPNLRKRMSVNCSDVSVDFRYEKVYALWLGLINDTLVG